MCTDVKSFFAQATQATDDLERLVDSLYGAAELAKSLAAGSSSRFGQPRSPEVPSPSSAEWPPADPDAGFDLPDFQPPQWVSRAFLHYETIPAEPLGVLSDLEDVEAETDLLASPHPATGGGGSAFDNDDESERLISPEDEPASSVPYVSDDDEEGEEEDPATARVGRQPPSSSSSRRRASAPQVRFRVPFPAFVPFPRSPTRPTPVFALSETSPPFPFPASGCTCRCACGGVVVRARRGDKFVFAVSVGTQSDSAASFAVGTQSESSMLSIGTQAESSISATESTGTQFDSPIASPIPATSSTGTQSESPVPATTSIGTQSGSPIPAMLSTGTQSDPPVRKTLAVGTRPAPAASEDSEYVFIDA